MKKGQVEIEIGGRKRLLKFGTNMTAIFSELRGLELKDTLLKIGDRDHWTISDLRDVIYSALAAGCHTSKTEKDFDTFDVGDWLDELNQDQYKKIWQAEGDNMPLPEKKTGELTPEAI